MFKAIIMILAVGVTSYAFADLESESAFLSVVLPIMVFGSLISFAIWLVLFIRKTGLDEDDGQQRAENNGPLSPDDFGGFGGSDGGV